MDMVAPERLWRPLKVRFLLPLGAVTQVQIYQVLIRHSDRVREILEVDDGRHIQANRDRLLHQRWVRIARHLHFGKVVLSSHCIFGIHFLHGSSPSWRI